MKYISVALVSTLIVVIGYFGLEEIDKHIDHKSGAIVERTLSDNTIGQLNLLSEVQSLIKAGELGKANTKLTEATETFVYILKNNCTLPKCEAALRNHESK